MSSLRNAVQRRSHRERAQPHERKRLGLLEKDKDRKLRQKDYKKKQQTLKTLRQKASERNEDEFYFGMLSRDGPGSRVQDGKSWSGTIAGDRGNKALSTDLVRLLKTQDMGYVRTMRNITRKEVERLRERVILATEEENVDGEDDDDFDFGGAASFSSVSRPKKIVFVDDATGREDEGQEPMDEDRPDTTAGGHFDQESEQFEDEMDKYEEDAGDEELNPDAERRAKTLQRLKSQLETAEKKLKLLIRAEEELEVQKAKMAKTATSGGLTRKGKKQILVRTRKR